MKCIGQLMWFLFKEIFDEILKLYRVACPKFGHPAQSLELQKYAYNTGYVIAVGMLEKKLNHL